ncbi:MAG: sensor histidine kinase [Firmicutes bacterium]|nr:sensor histidine kinase [Bacillota bacterium]
MKQERRATVAPPGGSALPESWHRYVQRGRYVNLVWLVFMIFPIQDLLRPDRTPTERLAGGAALLAFSAAYALSLPLIRPVWRDGWRMAGVAVMLALAVPLVLAFGSAWDGLFIYASVIAGFLRPPRHGAAAVACTTLLAVAAYAVDRQPWTIVLSFGVQVGMLGLAMVGLAQLFDVMLALQRAQRDAARLAAAEERLRIARDLHDLVGHSLSVIILKAELAQRLLPGQAERAATEVADIERTAREALRETRQAVSGYRQPDLGAELARAKAVLQDAGITCLVQDDAGPLEPRAASALVFAVREATTNVLRHSGATRCWIRLERRAGGVRLIVEDDGRGPAWREGADAAEAGRIQLGNGLAGIAERVQARGGRVAFARSPRAGFRMEAWLPAGHGGAAAGEAVDA